MTNYDPLVHPNQSTRSSAQTLMKTTNMDSQSSENWHLSSPVNKVMTSFLRKVRLGTSEGSPVASVVSQPWDTPKSL